MRNFLFLVLSLIASKVYADAEPARTAAQHAQALRNCIEAMDGPENSALFLGSLNQPEKGHVIVDGKLYKLQRVKKDDPNAESNLAVQEALKGKLNLLVDSLKRNVEGGTGNARTWTTQSGRILYDGFVDGILKTCVKDLQEAAKHEPPEYVLQFKNEFEKIYSYYQGKTGQRVSPDEKRRVERIKSHFESGPGKSAE